MLLMDLLLGKNPAIPRNIIIYKLKIVTDIRPGPYKPARGKKRPARAHIRHCSNILKPARLGPRASGYPRPADIARPVQISDMSCKTGFICEAFTAEFTLESFTMMHWFNMGCKLGFLFKEFIADLTCECLTKMNWFNMGCKMASLCEAFTAVITVQCLT